MKTKLSMVAVALLLSLVATSACYAQQYPLSVNIPFAFQAGDRTMPAGEYRVESALGVTRSFQRLRQVNGDAVMIFVTMPLEARNGHSEPELVFNCYGETKFLAQIWTGDREGRQLFQSKHEKQAANGERGREIALLLQPINVRP
jgi:hypothetical protein